MTGKSVVCWVLRNETKIPAEEKKNVRSQVPPSSFLPAWWLTRRTNVRFCRSVTDSTNVQKTDWSHGLLVNRALKFTPDGLAAVRAESIEHELLVTPCGDFLVCSCGLGRLCLRSSVALCHGHLLAVFGMVAAKWNVLQLEKVIALVTLERTQKGKQNGCLGFTSGVKKVSQINSSFCKNRFQHYCIK